ncbi:hypothetical protein P9J82_06995 [Glaesserella parasuis]|uniref:Membrane protein n=2 Tax=Glaesserella parasuis TaxID=738 RepID=A0A836MFT2_GLAPU|nr:hypothetical protein [Glaesserella parasuis]KDB49286.1 membrane protein [Glaesserella parasuis HPS10]MCT8526500.1 hypothetical protein [Glaesserella parasuis]MCT8527357.1 hypothetical protein [Glaesserella parasuis]MCT8529953.1 hypothetical protein [Glaesserella parasuis]MCT8531606.1 hypothetical protein [Glaesserella parasuis]
MSAFINLFYIYDPWLFHFFRMAFFCGGIAMLYLLYQIYRKQRLQGITLPLDSFVAIFILIIVAVIPMLSHGTKEFYAVGMYIKGLILFTCGVAIYNLCYYQKTNAKEMMVRDLKIGIIVQAVVGFTALAGIPFMIDLGISTNAVFPKFYGSEQEYRLYNLTSTVFFQLSLFYAFLLHFLLAYNAKYNNISPIFVFLLLCIGLISGRTFLFISAISFLVYFRWKYIPAILLFGTICLFLAFNFAENKYVQHALEPLINVIHGYGLVSSSTDNLVQNHLYIPELKQILIGDGRYFYPQGGYYGRTDSGFLRQTLYGGFIYLSVCFLFMCYFVRKVAINWFDGSWIFILSTLLILSILNVKADAYAFPGIMLVLLMFLSLFGNEGKNKILFLNNKTENV